MVENPPGVSARRSLPLRWLGEAVGFSERLRMDGRDGTIGHAEMELEGGVIMLDHPGGGYESPARHGHSHHLVHVYVDDVHFARAEAAGAKIVAPPETKPYGDRNYTAEDPEGQQWTFSQHVAFG
jgi:PhnB protein